MNDVGEEMDGLDWEDEDAGNQWFGEGPDEPDPAEEGEPLEGEDEELDNEEAEGGQGW